MKKRILLLFGTSVLILGVFSYLDKRQAQEGSLELVHTVETEQEENTPQNETTVGSTVQSPQEEETALPQGQELYAFQSLNEAEQTVYLQVYNAIVQRMETEVATTDVTLLEKVFQSVLLDHPEIFYVDGYTFTKYSRGNEITRLVFEASFTMSAEQIQENMAQIEARAEEIIQNVPAGADDYEKIKYVYDYIILNTEYNINAPNNQNICSVFLSHESVCQGYAKATQYLLQKLGIPVTLVVGTTEGGEGHAWNLVYADGEPYYVDTTWGDASYRMTTNESFEVNNMPVINYDYLCVTTEKLCRTHTIQNVVDMPVCTATKNNYYVREGCYFTAVDEEQLAQVFEKNYSEGNECVTIQCDNAEVYTAMYEALITEQKIFDYMDAADGVIAYTENEAQLSLSFWLSE